MEWHNNRNCRLAQPAGDTVNESVNDTVNGNDTVNESVNESVNFHRYFTDNFTDPGDSKTLTPPNNKTPKALTLGVIGLVLG